MGAVLEALLDLQDIELQIVDIRRQVAMKERLVRRQAAKLSSAQEQLTAGREALRRTQMDVDELDVSAKSRQAQVVHLREQLKTVRTNREYAAVLEQLNNENAERSRIETRELEMMEGVEAQRKVVDELVQGEQTEATRLGDFEAQSEQVRRTFAAKLDELQQQRGDAAAKLQAPVLAMFERLSERYEGEVMARIERTHPRRDEFSCGGCHMTLSAEAANAAMTRDDVQTCRSCGRMLHIEKGT